MSRRSNVGFGDVDELGMEMPTSSDGGFESDSAPENNVAQFPQPIDMGYEQTVTVTGQAPPAGMSQGTRVLFALVAGGLAYAATSGKHRLWYAAAAAAGGYALAPKFAPYMPIGLSGNDGTRGRGHQFPSGGGSADE